MRCLGIASGNESCHIRGNKSGWNRPAWRSLGMNKAIAIVVALAVLAGVGYFVLRKPEPTAPIATAPATTTTTATSTATTSATGTTTTTTTSAAGSTSETTTA